MNISSAYLEKVNDLDWSGKSVNFVSSFKVLGALQSGRITYLKSKFFGVIGES